MFYDADEGNPGGCIRIEESPNGQVSNLTLPGEFIGDWSQLTQDDFISFDYYLDSFCDEDIIDSEFVIQLVGESGKANAIANYIPSILSWQNITVNLNESEWDVVEGTWDELLMDINLVRIRNEYIIGDELVFFDSFCLSDNVVGIVSNKMDDIKTFPNPVNDFLHIDGESIIEHIMIFDLLGNKILDLESIDNVINVEHLVPNIYVLMGQTEKGRFVNKFVKN
ncbi:MAG: hypothetical protein ACJAZG_002041 [Granulosicoccus sp.]|jgi:hypothetical protein